MQTAVFVVEPEIENGVLVSGATGPTQPQAGQRYKGWFYKKEKQREKKKSHKRSFSQLAIPTKWSLFILSLSADISFWNSRKMEVL